MPQDILALIAKHWGWEVGDKVRQEIQNVINAHDIDINQLQNAIKTIQGLLDADPNTPEFDVGQNIITQLTDHLTRITNLESDVATLKAGEETVGSVAYAVKQERDRATAAEANLQSQIDSNKQAIQTLNGDENTEGSVAKKVKDAVDAEAAARIAADQALQDQINEITGGASGSISSLQSEIDAVEAGAGLNEDGTYTANTSTNYIDEATSLKDADEILDSNLRRVEDKVDALGGQTAQDIQNLDSRVSTLENEVGTLNGDENTEGSVKKQIADAKTEVKQYADNAAQTAANQAEANAKAYADENFVSKDALAQISAVTLASIFRQALDCGFDGKPKDDVLNGTGDCASAGANSASGDGDGGDGAVI